MKLKMLPNVGLSIILCILGVQCSSAWTLGRSISISMVGDVVIDTSHDRFICDQLECPGDAERCVVTKQQNANDTSTMIRSSTCYSQSNEVLKELVTVVHIDPETKVNAHIEATRRGAINVRNFSGSSDFDKEKFDKGMEQFHHNLNNKMEHLNKKLSDSNNEFHHNLNSRMEDLNERLSKADTVFHYNLNNRMDNLNKQLSDLNDKFHHNLNNRMENLNKQLSDMNNKLANSSVK